MEICNLPVASNKKFVLTCLGKKLKKVIDMSLPALPIPSCSKILKLYANSGI